MTQFGNWQEGTLNGYWYQAKVFEVGSQYGINGGRISKLAICKGDKWDVTKCVYNYDRGLDFDKCPPEVLQSITDLFTEWTAEEILKREG